MPQHTGGDAPSSENAPSGFLGKLASKPVKGNCIPLRTQDAAHDDGAEALRLAGLARHHHGLQRLTLIRCAGHFASRAIGAEPLREGVSR